MTTFNQIITLRDTLKLNYSSVNSFSKIVTFTDLPYNFDQIKKVWWRWYSDIYGFYYDRVKRSYSVWLTTFLKKNIGIYMPFFLKMPNKRSKVLDNWRRRAFLYEKTLVNKLNIFYNNNRILYLNFWIINYNQLSEAAKDILLTGNREHRQIGSYGLFGLELNMFISSYNARWNNLYKPESQFFNVGRMPSDFLIVINSFFISSGFFINSYDSQLLLYPQYYLEYYNKIFNKQIISLISFFELKYNIIFYNNILLLLGKLYFEFIYNKFFNYIDLILLNNNDFIIYKLNLFLFFIKYLKFYNYKILNINLFIIYSIFLNKFNFNKLTLLKNIYKYNKYNTTNYIYYIYFNNNLINKYNWLTNKYVNKKYLNKFDYLYKYLNKFNLFNVNIKEINSQIYLKKLYITEWIYLWEILEESHLNFEDIKQSQQSQYFIKKYVTLLKTKYEKIKDIYSILEYLTNLKKKYNKQNIYYNNYTLIKPSIKMTKLGLISKLTWVTNFGKHFVTIPYEYKQIKTVAYFYPNSFNKFRFISYIKYTKNFLRKIKEFLLNFSSVLISNLKINFGLSYTLINRKNNNLALDDYFMYNIQYYIYTYFSFIKQYFRSKKELLNVNNSFNLKNFNIFDKYFFFFLFFFPKIYKKKITAKNYFKSKYKGINLNSFGYLKFINKF